MENENQDNIKFRYVIDYNDDSYDIFIFHILEYMKSRNKEIISKAEANIAGKSKSSFEFIQKMITDGYLLEKSSEMYKITNKIPDFIFSKQ